MLVEFLKQYLDSDTLGIVCEFLINGDDYASFTTLQDIKCIEARIYNWNDCMQWAARVSNFPILKYVPEPPTDAPPKSISTLTAASLDFFHAFML